MLVMLKRHEVEILETRDHGTQQCHSAARVEAFGQSRVVDGEVLYRKTPASSRFNVSIRHRSTNLRFALVRWPHPRGLPPSSTTLASADGTR